jgi:hypothetical protein
LKRLAVVMFQGVAITIGVTAVMGLFGIATILIAIPLLIIGFFMGMREVLKQQGGIVRPPGHRLLSVIEFFCPRTAYQAIVVQSAADMRQEYYEALAAGRKFKAFWVRVRGTYALLKALGLSQFLRIAAEIFYRSRSRT